MPRKVNTTDVTKMNIDAIEKKFEKLDKKTAKRIDNGGTSPRKTTKRKKK